MQTPLAGWGNYPSSNCHLTAVETRDDLSRRLEAMARAGLGGPTLVPRGLGRSYGDQATNSGGHVLSCTAMDRYLGFDAESGMLHCDAGVSLEQIIEDFAPRGFFPFITPGTKFVTVGGCIANDIHGKAHHVDGSFVRCVDEISVVLADGRMLTASRSEHADLFWASFGGLGLLGVIVSARIRLRKIETTWFKQRVTLARNLEEMLDAIDTSVESEPYSVAWIDPLATGERLGRGVLTSGDAMAAGELPETHQSRALMITRPSPVTVPFRLPSHTLNRLSLPLVNAAVDFIQARGKSIAHYEKFFYPLDFINHWNRGYGKLGFTQYQFVIPKAEGRVALRPMLDLIAKSGKLPGLNVLKALGPEEGILSFPAEGYTLAIDFPIREGLDALLTRLDEMVLDAGGRVYLGKDAFCRAETFRAMYGAKLDRWLQIKAKYDPHNRFSSDIGRRLGLSGG